MTEEKIAQEKQTSPYDLWPDEIVQPEPVAASPFLSPSNDPFSPPANESFETPFEAPFVPVAYTPEPVEQTVRNSGLAWSAGVVFFGSVAFMLFIGWLADLILGSAPWGIVVGIVLGAVIGFMQFFRISSQIFNSKKDLPQENPLLSRRDDGE